jgi:hypothetical protein
MYYLSIYLFIYVVNRLLNYLAKKKKKEHSLFHLLAKNVGQKYMR